MQQWLIFSIDDQRFAIDLKVVNSVINSVEVNPCQDFDDPIMGLVDFHGTIIPIIDTRITLGFISTKLTPSDKFILCSTNQKLFGLRVDNVIELIDCQENTTQTIEDKVVIQGMDMIPQVLDIDIYSTLNNSTLPVNIS